MKTYSNLISYILFFNVIFVTFNLFAKNINIIGNELIDNEVIFSVINEHIIDPNEDDINSIIKKLKNINGVSDVSIVIIDDNLNIQIIENKKILDISFEGNERFDKSEFLELLNYKKYLDFYNEDSIDLYIQELEKLYLSFGYNQILIDYNVKYLDNNNFVDIDFIINEGKISKINKIYFIGNSNFKSNDLIKIIKSRQTNFLKFYSNSNFKLYEANNDIIRIKDFYKSKGYRDIVLKLKTEYISDKNKFNLYFVIDEGKKYYFDKFDLNFEISESSNISFSEVNKILDKNLLKMKKSDNVYNVENISHIRDQISSYLFENGQMFFEIKTLEKTDNNKINILFNIISISPTYINKINIYGNTRTVDKVIRREFVIAEGDASNSYLIQKSYNNIQKLNFFKKIDITEKNIDSNLIDLNINVEEKTTGDFKIGAAFGSLNGASVMAGLNEKNIGGVGRDFELAVDTSDKNTVYKLNVVEPYIFNKKLNLIYGLSYSNKDFSKTASYKLDKSEIKTGLNYMITDDLFHSVILKYNIKDYQITDSSKASASIINSDGTNAEWLINNIFTLNDLNSYYRPTSGSYYSINSTLSPITNSTNGYIQNILLLKNYYEINKNNILSLQTRIGNISSLQNSVVSTDNKFSLGGRWLRGFDSLGAGPRDSYSSYVGGNNIFVSKIDISRPLNKMSDNPIDINFFTDVGKVWENKNTPVSSNESIRASYGLGIKFYSPIGPIGFSWAFPLMDESYDNKRMFLFTIGDLN